MISQLLDFTTELSSYPLHGGGGGGASGPYMSKSADVDMSSKADISEIPDFPLTSEASPMLAPASYASILLNKDAHKAAEEPEWNFTDDDCSFSPGQHGMSKFAENVLAMLNNHWKSAVIVNLMGKPNSVNSYDFILRGLRRKWKSHGG